MQTSDIVTPLELRFLREFFATEAAQPFVLRGGTALAGFYLFHRRSKDLDLFTLDDEALEAAGQKAREIIERLGGEIVRARRSETFRQFVLQNPAQTLQVDLVREAVRNMARLLRMIVSALILLRTSARTKSRPCLGGPKPKTS